ncbi:RNase A-like domain-containing protein [Acuticoccus sp. MNP-M23]|uniref:RNase A-like domain-containing protein n=1 Tax=Acuticoccus sp. MNP-M23 TaxID=3072793 RepID=UPI002815D209|nr:RNase A-like domain-containing protein [Acuticoccus sp. MNP-M23]WMS43470.1 RNase A-like domain-containing protein [Acuticoccus sp. MNP-M23]
MSETDLSIVLTPLQLAALLEGETIDEDSSLNNRLWGVFNAVFGAAEMIGGAALFLIPEPTTVTKIGGGALALHGADTAQTGIYQIVTGKTRVTLTAKGAEVAASLAGADSETARNVGFAVDITVPLAAGFVGVLRAVAIRNGRLFLNAAEKAGGHTIARHISLSDEALLARLGKDNRISAVSSFRSLDDAAAAVSACLRANRDSIKTWTRTANAGSTKTFEFNLGKTIGRRVTRLTKTPQDSSSVKIVLKMEKSNNRL